MTFEEWWSGVIDEKNVGSVPEVRHKGIAKLAWEAAKDQCCAQIQLVIDACVNDIQTGTPSVFFRSLDPAA